MNVVSFYRFVDVAAPERLAAELQSRCDDEGLLGTILIAAEGFNGTLAGARDPVQRIFSFLAGALSLHDGVEGRWTFAETAPFRRMRVRVKQEIVALGRPDIKPQRETGAHIEPADWNRLIDDAHTLVIDARNHYETELGSFPNALDPGTDRFREFSAFAEELAATERDRPVAMFCTGGIRCEKASALLLDLGFNEVYQLRGGILNYLEQSSEENNRWQGDCFVFDSRVAVDRDLAEGGYVQCHACRRPLSSEDLDSPAYREGVSCPNCIDELSEERASRLEERRRQVALARARGDLHIGAQQPKKNLP